MITAGIGLFNGSENTRWSERARQSLLTPILERGLSVLRWRKWRAAFPDRVEYVHRKSSCAQNCITRRLLRLTQNRQQQRIQAGEVREFTVKP